MACGSVLVQLLVTPLLHSVCQNRICKLPFHLRCEPSPYQATADTGLFLGLEGVFIESWNHRMKTGHIGHLVQSPTQCMISLESS